MLANSAISQYRKKTDEFIDDGKIGHPHGTAVDCFITEFSKQDDISCLYVTHNVQSGFVTYKIK